MHLKNEKSGIEAIIIASFLNVIMGAGFYYARTLDANYSPMTGVFLRVLANLIFIFLPLFTGGNIPKAMKWKGNRSLWIWGFCGLLTTTSFFLSVSSVGAGIASFLNAGSSIFIASLGPIIAHQKTPLKNWMGIILSLAGLFLITSSQSNFDGQIFGYALGVFSGLASGIGYLLVARTREKYKPETVMLHWTIVSLAFFMFYFLFMPARWPQSLWAWITICITGLAAAGAQYLTTKAYQNAPVSLIACLTYLSPVFSVFVDILYFHIPMDTRILSGIFIVLVFGAVLPVLKR